MIDFLEQHMWSSIILGIGIALVLLELILTLIGGGFEAIIESISGDIDIDADIDTDGDFSIINWINQGKIPTSVLLVLTFTFWGGISLFMSYITNSALPDFIMLVIAFFVMLYPLRYTTVILNKILPNEHTVAVSKLTFIGKVVEIVEGNASQEFSAEAKLIDDFGNTHHISVKPESDEVINSKNKVLILEFDKEKNIFIVTRDLNRLIEED
jgi:hypothetical protein